MQQGSRGNREEWYLKSTGKIRGLTGQYTYFLNYKKMGDPSDPDFLLADYGRNCCERGSGEAQTDDTGRTARG